jgi:hypothetical protein
MLKDRSKLWTPIVLKLTKMTAVLIWHEDIWYQRPMELGISGKHLEQVLGSIQLPGLRCR